MLGAITSSKKRKKMSQTPSCSALWDDRDDICLDLWRALSRIWWWVGRRGFVRRRARFSAKATWFIVIDFSTRWWWKWWDFLSICFLFRVLPLCDTIMMTLLSSIIIGVATSVPEWNSNNRFSICSKYCRDWEAATYSDSVVPSSIVYYFRIIQ